jgi:hypothetical protein
MLVETYFPHITRLSASPCASRCFGYATAAYPLSVSHACRANASSFAFFNHFLARPARRSSTLCS